MTCLRLSALALCVGCAALPPPTLPPHPAGCPVTVYRVGVPKNVEFTTLGDVQAPCGKNDADSDCIRALQDEVCKLGGNIVVEVPEAPEPQSDSMLRY
ncbi:MAG TPA: hypothetical protein PLM08_25330, partial [Polyangiaceae bacterium]|nr:hypothetical protein [Polyangiaceae bacterium]